jgi:hypothetical protein
MLETICTPCDPFNVELLITISVAWQIFVSRCDELHRLDLLHDNSDNNKHKFRDGEPYVQIDSLSSESYMLSALFLRVFSHLS